MATYHPSYLLRNASITEKRKVWEDLLKVMERLEMPISEKQRGFFPEGVNGMKGGFFSSRFARIACGFFLFLAAGQPGPVVSGIFPARALSRSPFALVGGTLRLPGRRSLRCLLHGIRTTATFRKFAYRPEPLVPGIDWLNYAANYPPWYYGWATLVFWVPSWTFYEAAYLILNLALMALMARWVWMEMRDKPAEWRFLLVFSSLSISAFTTCLNFRAGPPSS